MSVPRALFDLPAAVPGPFEVREEEKPTIRRMCTVVDGLEEVNPGAQLVLSFDYLFELVGPEGEAVARRYLTIDATYYGVVTPYLGLTDAPAGLVALENQECMVDGEVGVISTQYVPGPTYAALLRLNRAMREDIGERVLVESGYRSAAYQLIVLLDYLSGMYGYDLAATLKHVALPGYSQHGFCPEPYLQGVDLMSPADHKELEGSKWFEGTRQFAWLQRRGAEFGFTLSYPEGNPEGIRYEPWHWAHRLL